MRFILLHRHVFKNAGSTLDGSLLSHFGENFTAFHPESSDGGRVYPQQLFELLERNPNLQAISSHHFWDKDFSAYLDEQRQASFIFFDFALLRHPVSRLASTYLYYQRFASNGNPIQVAAQRLPFNEFIEHLVEHHPNYVINPQVTIFGCDHYGAPPSKHNLDIATSRLMRMSLIGTVEKYDEAMATATYMLQPVFEGLNLQGSIKNKSDNAAIKGYDGSLKSSQRTLGNDLFDRLCELNDLDIRLWSRISEESARRFKYVPAALERQRPPMQLVGAGRQS
ncbi:sulfotransferase family 2 domain-containing protein [Pseudoduganella violaceinigra]|uniref:sulfotransferase family 2 domain-containing protein n=1 Tax=Pseudoduganella violaceinigra TaxID=246602 RepID=UPI0013771919|nr:sulfotransferase family 2 domain-containing protein [Pseudoduganella violaceinigra]